MSTRKKLRRIAVTVAGSIVLFAGILLIFLPGPGIIVILLGLGILSLEFEWANRLVDKVRNFIKRKMRNNSSEQ